MISQRTLTLPTSKNFIKSNLLKVTMVTKGLEMPSPDLPLLAL